MQFLLVSKFPMGTSLKSPYFQEKEANAALNKRYAQGRFAK